MIQNVELDLPREVLQRIDALAAKLGTTVDLLWPELVKYEYGKAIGSVAAAVVSAALLSACLAYLMRAAKVVRMSGKVKCTSEEGYSFATKTTREWEEDAVPLSRPHIIILTAVSCALAIIFLACVGDACSMVPNLISPSGAALRSLMGR